MPSASAFLKFWRTDRTRDAFLRSLSSKDLASMRVVCHDFADAAAPFLFHDVSITFRSTTFTKHSRLAALERIGHHIKTFQFNIPHSAETLLPPIIDSTTGEEVAFIYEPYTQLTRDPNSRLSIPSYGSWEMTDLLVRQYPPLFHAAANVPSFIKAFSMMQGINHLTIRCPSQEKGQRYRRSIVDYALISVRMAVERNKLLSLDTLSLLDVHPAVALYLNPRVGFGATPNSSRRWRQIRSLNIHMNSVSSHDASATDHYKHLQCYLDIFTPTLRQLDFRWLGDRCHLPITFKAGSLLQKSHAPGPPSSAIRSQGARPLRFARLRHLSVENTIADARQIARFIARHHRAVRHTRRLNLNFHDTILSSGTWDEALEPLTRMSGSDSWKSSSEESSDDSLQESIGQESAEEFMDVPIMFSSPVHEKEDLFHKVWDDHVRSRTSKQHISGIAAKTKELLFGTEEHMRKLFKCNISYM
ncbi:uncharacterized protein KY384_001526 [Bacidia gigantensis]|uniref:uncharacterized protein n=1 Tax=Bacidia gigantensis TaxID=2732470 RepID=UPI001D03F57E|nr:uncharacterized protein KY384_001526 [Bacidia gigantensis]KAG8533785.1 hypothetical protein KY384_001526 [Bacidia gigantensis]